MLRDLEQANDAGQCCQRDPAIPIGIEQGKGLRGLDLMVPELQGQQPPPLRPAQAGQIQVMGRRRRVEVVHREGRTRPLGSGTDRLERRILLGNTGQQILEGTGGQDGHGWAELESSNYAN